MITPEAKRYLEAQSRKFLLLRMTEVKLQALGIGLLAAALLRLFVGDSLVVIAVGTAVFLMVLGLRIRRTDALKWNSLRVALFLNRRFPELQDSADLLVSDRPATTLEELQRSRVLQRLEAVKPRVRVPHRLGQGLLIFITGLVALMSLPSAVYRAPVSKANVLSDTVGLTATAPALQRVQVMVMPPAYTGLRSYPVAGADFKAPAGSGIRWRVEFSGRPMQPAIRISSGDSLALNPPAATGTGFEAVGRAIQPSFYQVTWGDESGKRYASEFYRADVREDAPPAIEIVGREQFQVVKPGASLQFEVSARVSDDYAVRDAHLVATVSKGSGESVKFREVTIPFDNARFPSRQASLSRSIDLAGLGLEPGDELYFYAEAIDNRVPTPNLTRTETFFIALQDTAQAVAVADAGLGVDLMPDYFRSQRQIIIDTEKLLAEQRKIRKQDFNARSNELGFDQKALRLKYGQFLGMEDEAGIGVVPGPEEKDHAQEEDKEDPSKKFGHQHDKENEHNLVEEKKGGKEAEHDHGQEEKDGDDPLKAFLHQHDSEEEATFFIQSVKAKLKAALTLMWDSELHLRMYEPKKSLPYQYRILNLLKEIAQDNRAYVHRTGFDAPPIKEERRLTGDLEEVSSTIQRVQRENDRPFPAIQAALLHFEEQLQQNSPASSDMTRKLCEAAGFEVADEALKKPGNYLQTLSALRKLADGAVPPEKWESTVMEVRRDFWRILPEETYDPSRGLRTLHPLDRAVLEKMEKSHD